MAIPILVQNYPQFVANQVLTQDQLNNMRDFLNAQNRSTRVRMVGIGIICGLHARVETVLGVTTLYITEGYGVTSEGWLIYLPAKEYIHLQVYNDPHTQVTDGTEHPVYEPWQTAYDKVLNTVPLGGVRTQIPFQILLEEEDPIDPSTALLPTDLDGKVLVLYLEINENELKSCFTTDCNNKGQSIELEVVALLAEKDNRFLPASDCKELGEIQFVPRFNTGLKMVPGNPDNVNEIDAPAEITSAYEHICNHLNDQLKTKLLLIFTNPNTIYFDLFEVEAQINSLASDLDNLLAEPNFDQYRYDIYKDIAQAYNECVQHLCHIVEPCCNTEHFPRHLIIRDFEGDPPVKDPAWRHPFYPSPVKNVMYRDFEKARNLFVRILELIDHYSFTSNGIKITPSQNETYPLAERAIPFYYDKDEVAPTWQLGACCTFPALSYEENLNQAAAPANYLGYLENPLHYNLNACTFLRIEGFLGMDYNTALSQIISQREIQHLDFQILALPLVATAIGIAPPNQIFLLYNNTQQQWISLNLKIDNLEISKPDFDAFLMEIEAQHSAIVDFHNDWCDTQAELELACDYSSLQSDYGILRAELLCFLHKCKPIFTNLPEIELEDNIGGNGEVCVDFSSVSPDTKFGDGSNTPGQEIFTENNVPVTILPFDGPDPFGSGNAQVNAVTGEISIFINSFNLKFDFNPTVLGFNVTEVRISYTEPGTSSLDNIGVNNFGPFDAELSGIAGVGEVQFGSDHTIEIIQINDDSFLGIIRGPIQSITIGGQQMFLNEVCAFGDGAAQPAEKNLPPFAFQSRFARIQLLCDLLEGTTSTDIRCFNFPLFQLAIKDLMGAAMEIKLLLGCIFKSAQGAFLPYKFYPEWNDLEDCLDHFHGNCLYPQLAVLYYNFQSLLGAGANTFGEFTTRYPGAEHRAGVSKGGTFIMVYEDEANTNVVADFSLEHFVEDCCPCKLDVDNINYPPIALPDYVMVEITPNTTTVELDIPVTLNDFSLDDAGTIGLSDSFNPVSDKGADLQILNATSEIRYILNEPQPGIDHFTYIIKDNSGLFETGHVYIGLFDLNAQLAGKGTASGAVTTSGSGAIVGAKINVLDKAGNIVTSATSGIGGVYTFEVEEGIYDLQVSHNNYFNKTFTDQEIVANQVTQLEKLTLRRSFILTDDRFKKNVETVVGLKKTLKDNPAYLNAETFITDIVIDKETPLDEVTNQYKVISKALIKANKVADEKMKSALETTIKAVTHSFMDRVILEDTDEADFNALGNLKQAIDDMKKAGINTGKILTDWKSNNLKTKVGGGNRAISTLRALYKN